MSQIDAREPHGEVKRGLYLPELRSLLAKMAGAMRRLRRVEHPGRGGFGRQLAQAARQVSQERRPHLVGGCRGHRRGAPVADGIHGARSRPRRRPGPRFGGPDRRGPRDRQIDADAPGGRCPQSFGSRAVCHRRGILEAGRIARTATGLGSSRGEVDRRHRRRRHHRSRRTNPDCGQ